MWLDKLKLSKQLVRAVTDAGFLAPKDLQAKTMSRIIGGQDIIAVGPEGSGKTTTYILGVLARLKYGVEEAPRALILVPDKDRVLAVMDSIAALNSNPTIRVVGLYPAPGTEAQMDALADGADIVVATPDRARAIYLKLGLNLNKIIMYVVDDADQIVKQGLQLPVVELANSIRNCQHLIFTEVLHDKLNLMISPFMKQPALIEVDELEDVETEVFPQLLYQVPNFKTKLNLLHLLVNDDEVFTKVAVFVNTRLTAEKVYQTLKASLKSSVAILNPISYDSKGFNTLDAFRDNDNARVLIIANEGQGDLDLNGIPFLIHFELPEEKETFIKRIIKSSDNDSLAITFSTDIELSTIRKIEQSIGKRIPVAGLPDNLVVVTDQPEAKKKEKSSSEDFRGEAFHEKKASNAKDYNYSAGRKAKMTNKRKH